MTDEPKATPQDATGHYGPGYGEATEHLGKTPIERPAIAPLPLPVAGEADAAVPDGTTDAAPVFTPEDVTLTPPDRAPTEAAPASDDAALIFERS